MKLPACIAAARIRASSPKGRRRWFACPARAAVLLFSVAMSAAHAGSGTLVLQPLSQIQLPSWAAGSEARARIDGERLVIPRGAGGVSVYDIADPAHPAEIVTVDTATLEDQAAASALLSSGLLVVGLPIRQTLSVIDISGPTPIKRGEFGSIPQLSRLEPAPAGLFAYASSSVGDLGGVYTFDTSTTLPTETGDYLVDLIDPGFYARSDAVTFFARTPPGPTDPAQVDVVDLSDPAQPVLLGSWAAQTPGNIVGIDVAGNRMVLAAYWGGVWSVDISDFSDMRLLDHHDAADSRVYSTDVVYLPPFVLLPVSGPAPALRGLELLRMRDDGTLEDMGTTPLTLAPTALLHRGSLLVLQSVVVNDFGNAIGTQLDLFSVDATLFADGFDGG